MALRQRRLAHQVTVALARRPAALVDGPDDQALAAAHVAGGEYPRHAGREPAVLRPGVGAGVLLDAELVKELVLRAEEAHRQQHELGGEDALTARHLAGD